MSAKDVRNICLLGHGGSGKTTLAESMLFLTGGTDRFGKVADGNTTCDYDPEEIKRSISISLAVAPVKYKNVKINVLDAPGNFDFAGEALSAIRASECAVLVCGAKDGLSVGAQRCWKMLGKKPRMIFINRTDEDNSDYNACFAALKEKFGAAIAPIVAPVTDDAGHVTAIVDLLHNKAYEIKGGKAVECAIPAAVKDEAEAARAELMEAAAGADEELMEKFFDTMELSDAEIAKGLKLGVKDGSVAPVLCGSATTGLGVDMLMQTIIDLVPIATDMDAEAAKDDDGKDIEVAHDENGATAAIVFKTISDQYGKYSLIKVVRGKVTSDMSLYNPTTGNTEKLGRLYTIKGKKNEEVKEICCGDIGAIAKMDRVRTGDTLCDAKNVVVLKGMDFAEPCYSRAIAPKTRGQEDKLGTGLNRLNEEDPTFTITNNAETHQIVIAGAGEAELRIRRPFWTQASGVSDYVSHKKVWKVGDTVEIPLPCRFRRESVVHSQTGSRSTAVFYGPILMGAHLGIEGMRKDAVRSCNYFTHDYSIPEHLKSIPLEDPATWTRLAPPPPYDRGMDGASPEVPERFVEPTFRTPKGLIISPFWSLSGERMCVYFEDGVAQK